MTLPANEKLSTNFYLSELTDSQTASRLGLDNSAPKEVFEVAIKVAQKMEEVRALLRHAPIIINSWYRSPEVNAAVGGSRTSQHCKGEAIDFTARRFGTPQEICLHLSKLADHIEFDQLIFEHTWVHISFNFTTNRPPRKQVLTLLANKKYASGVLTKKEIPYGQNKLLIIQY